MSVKAKVEFDDFAEHTMDTTKLTLLDDKGQQKAQFSPDEILFANYDADGINVSKRGAKVIAFSGVDNTGQVLDGLLKFTVATRSLGIYAGIDSIVDDFALRCRIETLIGSTVLDRDLMVLKSNVDNSQIRFLYQNAGGGLTRIVCKVTDSAGAIANSVVLTTVSLAVAPNANIALSIDDDGNMLCYLDGVLKDTSATPALDFTDCDLIFGDDSLGRASANYDNVQLWKSNFLTEGFAFPFPEPTTFVLDELTMLTSIPFIVNKLTSIDIIHEIPAGAQLGFFNLIGGIPHWVLAGSWVVANGKLAETNTLAEIQAAIDTIPIVEGIGKLLQLGAIFKSDTGYDTALIESTTYIFNMAFKSGNVFLCSVTSTVIDNAGQVVVGATVRVQSKDKFINNVLVGPSAKALTGPLGKFSISIPETETDGTAVDIFVEYTEKRVLEGVEFDAPVIFEHLNKIIPNVPTADLDSLATL